MDQAVDDDWEEEEASVGKEGLLLKKKSLFYKGAAVHKGGVSHKEALDRKERYVEDAVRKKGSLHKDASLSVEVISGLDRPWSSYREAMGGNRNTVDEIGGFVSQAIGREKEKEEIIDQLILLQKQNKTSESADALPVPVVAIVGIAGIGKTTLARLVCEDERVKDLFGSPIMIRARETFDLPSVGARVSKVAVTGRKSPLLVLDDLRIHIRYGSDAIAKLLRNLRADRVSVGAILVTTRRIGLLAKATYVLHLQGLDEKQSRFLLQQLANDSSRIKPDDEISKISVRKCRGVPLAIMTMASLCNSGVDGVQAAGFNKVFLRELKSIYYDDLPTRRHKECFAYLSRFPEDHLINAEAPSKIEFGSTIFGSTIFNEFIELCIFQDVKQDEDGVVRSCRVHPLMHDLACFVAEKDFFNTMGLLHNEASAGQKRYVGASVQIQEAAVRKKEGLVDEEASVAKEIQLADEDGTYGKSKRVEPIGREKEKKEIIDQLILFQKKTNESADALPVPVVAIVGIAGIGKTELARLVCEDEQVIDRFGSPITIFGLETFDLQSVAARVSEIAVTAGGKCHLLVLDDLRADILYRSDLYLTKLLSKLMEDGVSVGAVLVTTRSISLVAKAAYVLHLQGLDEKQSRFLFQQLASVKQDEEISKIIVGKCRGVPRAIMAAARLVNSGADSRQVAEFNELFLEELMSFYHDVVPMRLKRCFAYASLFPHDYLIDAERLIHLWMAEGFLNWYRRPEGDGRGYLDEFVDLCIFQDVKQDKDGVVRSCRVHPLMHDLACFVAKKDNFNGMDPVPDQNIRDKLRRASLDFRLAVPRRIPGSLFKTKELRTILFHAKTESPLPHEVKMSTSTCEKIFTTFERLRVLDLQFLGIKMVPGSIGKLKYLLHLDLSHNNVEKLPSSITKLSLLKTLKLSQCHFLKELPKDLKDLSSLKHLDIEGCLNLTHMPRGISNLIFLETLSHFVVGKDNRMGGLEELSCLNYLTGHLEILYLERLKFQAPSPKCLKEKKQLQRLTLRWDQHDEGGRHHDDEKSLEVLEPQRNLKVLHVVGYKGGKFPSWLPSLHSLVKFSLYNCARCEFLPPLDKLPSLKILELERMYSLKFIAEECDSVTGGSYDRSTEIEVVDVATTSSITTPTAPFFPSLKELTLWDCPNLESWWKTDDNVNGAIFSCISSLRVQHCPRLSRMPLYPGLDETLVLVDTSAKPMLDTLHCETEDQAFVPLSNVKSMQIASIKQSPQESLPQGLKHLSSLQSLTIENCPILGLESSSDEWEGLRNLRSLIIRGISELNSLPTGLENVKSLQEIRLHDCPELTSLPESIGNLASLGRLEIRKCSSLGSLPRGMEKLNSLLTLIIKDCPLLLPRCQPETGDDWPQIAHIKNILVKQTSEDFELGKSGLSSFNYIL